MSASRPRLSILFLLVLLCAVVLLTPGSHGDPSTAPTKKKQRAPKFQVLSSRADLVSGGRPLGAPPASKSCNGRRTIGILLPRALRARRREARLMLGGKTVARFGSHVVARARFRGRKARTLRLRVVGRTRAGKRRRQVRSLRLCAGRRR